MTKQDEIREAIAYIAIGLTYFYLMGITKLITEAYNLTIYDLVKITIKTII